MKRIGEQNTENETREKRNTGCRGAALNRRARSLKLDAEYACSAIAVVVAVAEKKLLLLNVLAVQSLTLELKKLLLLQMCTQRSR